MKFGYACINLSINSKFRTCRLGTVESEGMQKVKEITLWNLKQVLKILEWNKDNGLMFYRLSSEIIPFASHDIMTWEWWKDEDVLEHTGRIKTFKQAYGMRLSMHPGQFTVINSINPKVVENSLKELDYQDRLMNLIGATDMIIHTGGAYGDKTASMKRFIDNYNNLLSDSIKSKMRLENDDKVFALEDVLSIYQICGVPICFDIHHHICNTYENNAEDLVPEVFRSWEGYGLPKIHLSTGKDGISDFRHHEYINPNDFIRLLDITKGRDFDLMIEAKAKDKAVLRLLNDLSIKENKEII